MFDFDKVIDRRGTNSTKWDFMEEKFGTSDAYSMWIADMDFEVSPFITEEFRKIVDQKVYGYHILSDKYFEVIQEWMKKRHNYSIEKEWILTTPNIVAALNYAVQAVSDEGDEIIANVPVYGMFFNAVKNNNRILVESELINRDGYYTMDFEDFENKITPKTKAALICNPHNPSGRVWKSEELIRFVDICIRHNLYIISDEIHSEMIWDDCQHTVIATLSEQVADRSIICMSPSKAFNLAGIKIGHCYIKNAELRQRIFDQTEIQHLHEGSIFSEAAVVGAYDQSEQWLDELNVYLEENIDYFVEYIQKYIPMLQVCKPESTYLIWVDCRKLPIEQEKLSAFFVEKCKVAIFEGTFFGEKGAGFVRFNVGCRRQLLKPILEKMKSEIEKLK